MSRLTIVSADGHCGAKAPAYKPHLERKYWDALDQLAKTDEGYFNLPIWRESASALEADDRGAIQAGGRIEGAGDFERRLKEMDADGVAGELVGAGNPASTALWFSGECYSAYPAELRDAGTRAFDRWLADGLATTGGRILGIHDPGSCLDMDAVVKELRWVREHGFAATTPPGTLTDPANPIPPLWDSYHDPFWKACVENDMRLFVHAMYGVKYGSFKALLEAGMTGDETETGGGAETHQAAADNPDVFKAGEFSEDVAAICMAHPRRVFWEMLLGGVFDRYPELKVAFTELRSTWVPGFLATLDKRFEQERVPLEMKPSEYWQQHCWVTPSDIRTPEVAMRHEVGVEKIMFGVDYPHPEGTWPNTREWIQATFGYMAVPESDARPILGENAIDFYGFDRATLLSVAERIGPEVEDVLDPLKKVDTHKIESFDERAGFLKPIGHAMFGLTDLFESELVNYVSS